MKRPVDPILKKLKNNCPLKTQLRVIYKSLEDERVCGLCSAYCDDKGEIVRFVIAIDCNLTGQSLLDTVLHEYAHALDMEKNGIGRIPHRVTWGIAYAKVWRAYTKPD